MLKLAPGEGSKREQGNMELVFWAPGKTLLFEKSMAKHWAGRHFGNIAKTRAVRKGELLRGMVSQGGPHPSRLGVKVFRSDHDLFLAER